MSEKNKEKIKSNENISSSIVPKKITIKLIISSLLFILFFSTAYFFFDGSIKQLNDEKIYYKEKGTLDYKVKVKPNKFYEDEYLEKNMSYIASLIDTIYVDFNYEYEMDKALENGRYFYQVVGDLEIRNTDNNELFFSKKYNLEPKKTIGFNKGKSFDINKIVNIDYDYYNSLANKFKATYGVNAKSTLKVYLDTGRTFSNNMPYDEKLNGNSKMYIEIPLSEKAISIKLKYNNISNEKSIIASNGMKSWNVRYLILGIISLGLLVLCYLYIVNRVFEIQPKRTTYDRALRKILREYDRLIVNSVTMPNLKNHEVTEVKEFIELLDAKENLHKPIYYYDVKPHVESYFYIKSDSEIVLFKLKDENIIVK